MAMGKAVVHAGAAGSGQAAKICNNMMLGIQMISVCEAMALLAGGGGEAPGDVVAALTAIRPHRGEAVTLVV